MEYCCNTLADAPSSYLDVLDKLQKQVCGTVGPTIAGSLESSVHYRNLTSLSLFYRYYFGRYLTELAELALLPYSRGPLFILVDCMIFLSPFLEVMRMSISSFFRGTEKIAQMITKKVIFLFQALIVFHNLVCKNDKMKLTF